MVVTEQQDRKLTYEDAAAEFRVSVSTIRNWVARGYINQYSKPLDRKKYVSSAEIEALRNAEPRKEERD